MAKQRSPHEQTQQDTHFAQTDVNPGELEQEVGVEVDAEAYENMDGAETGAERSPKHTPGSANPHNTEPQTAAYEGSLRSRTSEDDTRQGISNRSAKAEAKGQRKVVSEREDAQAGVNHSDKIPD
ncbi:hypothetical protein DYQ86_27015 [Acidobacteria bacterium AB60]|nr:hypothetical protein DYQ86_27015 [Acidobacteria bacterium AB60]